MVLFAMPLFIALFMVGCQNMGGVDSPAVVQLSPKEEQLIKMIESQGTNFAAGYDYVYGRLASQLKMAKSGANVNSLSSPQVLGYNFKLYCQEFVYDQHTKEQLIQVNNLITEASKIQYSQEFVSFKKQTVKLAKQHLSVEEFDTKIDVLIRQAVSQLKESEDAAFVNGAVAIKNIYHSWKQNKEMLDVVKFAAGAQNSKGSSARIAGDCMDGCHPPPPQNEEPYGHWEDSYQDPFEPDWAAAMNNGAGMGMTVGSTMMGAAAWVGAMASPTAWVGIGLGFAVGFGYGVNAAYQSQQANQTTTRHYVITRPVIVTPCP